MVTRLWSGTSASPGTAAPPPATGTRAAPWSTSTRTASIARSASQYSIQYSTIQCSAGKYRQIGITSFGSGFGCEIGYPAAFTRVASFLEWIETHTGIAIDP